MKCRSCASGIQTVCRNLPDTVADKPEIIAKHAKERAQRIRPKSFHIMGININIELIHAVDEVLKIPGKSVPDHQKCPRNQANGDERSILPQDSPALLSPFPPGRLHNPDHLIDKDSERRNSKRVGRGKRAAKCQHNGKRYHQAVADGKMRFPRIADRLHEKNRMPDPRPVF